MAPKGARRISAVMGGKGRAARAAALPPRICGIRHGGLGRVLGLGFASCVVGTLHMFKNLCLGRFTAVLLEDDVW